MYSHLCVTLHRRPTIDCGDARPHTSDAARSQGFGEAEEARGGTERVSD